MTTETTTADTPTTWTPEVGRLSYRGDVVDAVLFRYTTTDDVEAMAVGGGHRG